MRDKLNMKADENECFVLDIHHSSNNETHWTSLFIKDGLCYYFDSFGYPPPQEIEAHIRKYEKQYYSNFEIQKRNQVICEHFCIYMLLKLGKGKELEEILDVLFKYNYK